MRRGLSNLKNIFKQRRIQQGLGLGFSVVAVKQLYNKYYSAYCDEDKSQSLQAISLQNDQNQSENEEEDIITDKDMIVVNKYQDLSDLIIHHKTHSECLVFLPGCSDESKKILLKTMQKKRENKQFKVMVFKPSKNIPNAVIQKREQDKERDLQDKLKGVEFFGINSFGDLKYFSLNQESEVFSSKNTLGREINLSTYFQRIMNFFNPPKLIGEREFPHFVQSIQEMGEEERIIMSYVPEEKVYEANMPKINTFDLYRQGRIKNISQLESRFRDISYEYVEKNTKFVIIRNADVAQSLSIGSNDIGEIYILKRSNKQMNNESNWFFQGSEYLYNKIEWDPNSDVNIQLNSSQILEKLYQRSFNYVNSIHTEQDLNNLLSSANEVGINKFLLYYSAEALEEDYEQRITKKLISVKKNIPDQDFIVIFTKNPLLLKNYFRIIPEKTDDTIRLLDYSKKPKVADNKLPDWTTLVFYSAVSAHTYIPKEQSIYSEPSVYQVNSDDAHRYKYPLYEGKITRNKLTYFVKQSLQQKEQVYYECEYPVEQYSSRFLNAANFNSEILENKSDDICLVYFYKPGCPNCHAMNRAIEKFNLDLETIKEEVNQYDKGIKEYKPYDENLINEYHIDNYSKLKKVKIYRYNIYNECKEFPSPSASPLIFIFTKENRNKPQQTDLLKDRVNLNDQEKVSRYLFKKIDFLDV